MVFCVFMSIPQDIKDPGSDFFLMSCSYLETSYQFVDSAVNLESYRHIHLRMTLWSLDCLSDLPTEQDIFLVSI